MGVLNSDTSFVIGVALGVTFLILTLFLVVLVFYQRAIRKKQREIFWAVQKTQIDEQQRIARDLHDDVGPVLATARIRLEQILITSDPEHGQHKHLEPIKKLLDESLVGIRNASHNLSSRALEREGINQAIDDFCVDIDSGAIEVRLIKNDELGEMHHIYQNHLYRITKELIYNAIKHSGGRHVWVSVSRNGKMADIEVSDDGKGLNPGKDMGIGLQNVQNRVQLLKGQFHKEHRQGGGARFIVTVPVKAS